MCYRLSATNFKCKTVGGKDSTTTYVENGIDADSADIGMCSCGSFIEDLTPFMIEGEPISYQQKAKEIADLVERKQLAYGDSFGNSGKVLKILYPNGINLSQFDDLLTITRIIDKLFRIANDKKAFEENPWNDIVGYALLAATREENK